MRSGSNQDGRSKQRHQRRSINSPYAPPKSAPRQKQSLSASAGYDDQEDSSLDTSTATAAATLVRQPLHPHQPEHQRYPFRTSRVALQREEVLAAAATRKPPPSYSTTHPERSQRPEQKRQRKLIKPKIVQASETAQNDSDQVNTSTLQPSRPVARPASMTPSLYDHIFGPVSDNPRSRKSPRLSEQHSFSQAYKQELLTAAPYIGNATDTILPSQTYNAKPEDLPSTKSAERDVVQGGAQHNASSASASASASSSAVFTSTPSSAVWWKPDNFDSRDKQFPVPAQRQSFEFRSSFPSFSIDGMMTTDQGLAHSLGNQDNHNAQSTSRAYDIDGKPPAVDTISTLAPISGTPASRPLDTDLYFPPFVGLSGISADFDVSNTGNISATATEAPVTTTLAASTPASSNYDALARSDHGARVDTENSAVDLSISQTGPAAIPEYTFHAIDNSFGAVSRDLPAAPANQSFDANFLAQFHPQPLPLPDSQVNNDNCMSTDDFGRPTVTQSRLDSHSQYDEPSASFSPAGFQAKYQNQPLASAADVPSASEDQNVDAGSSNTENDDEDYGEEYSGDKQEDYDGHEEKPGRCKFRAYQAENWTLRFRELLEYTEEFGHCLVPNNFPPNPVLAQWVKRQRYQYKLKIDGKRSTMSDERVAALENIGFVWDSHSAVWQERLEELLRYKALNGDCNVPSRYQANRQLAIWVKRQRRQYKFFNEGKQSSMTLARIQTLENVGFEWDIKSSRRRSR